MPEDFKYDVFSSHGSNEKLVVCPIAETSQRDVLLDSAFGFRASGFGFPLLAVCLSANAFGSDWAQLECGAFRLRDPLKKDRRVIPLRLDDAPTKSSLVQFLSINWCPADREEECPDRHFMARKSALVSEKRL